MRARIVPIEDISASEIVQWNNWAAPSGTLLSPYLRFEFAECVSRARSDVRVAVFEDENGVLGFFPHHTKREGVIRPIGAPMSDYQGVIARDYSKFTPQHLLRAAGASALVFDNWYCPAGGHKPSRRSREGSVMVDLSAGAHTYFQAQKSSFKDHFKKSARRLRAAERDLGPVRVELGDASGVAFSQLMAWKRRQYRETGKLDVLGIDWVQNVLSDLRRREGQEFCGLTASLWFGDRLAAVEFGLKGADIYHSWFPAYDPELAKYSPGLLLLHGIFEQAEAHGVSRIDLGRTGAQYKKYYTSYEIPLDQGRFLQPGLAAMGIYSWESAEKLAEVLPPRLAALPGRVRRRWAQVSAFQPQFPQRMVSLASSITA